MKKRLEKSPLEADTLKRLGNEPQYAQTFFTELAKRTIPVQMALLRKLHGISQIQLAERLKMKQAHVSKLERHKSDHLLSNYERFAEELDSRLAFIPKGATIVMPKGGKK